MTIAVTSAAITIPTTITLKAWQEIDSLIIELYTFTVTAYDCSIRFQGVTGQRTLAVLPMNTVTSSQFDFKMSTGTPDICQWPKTVKYLTDPLGITRQLPYISFGWLSEGALFPNLDVNVSAEDK